VKLIKPRYEILTHIDAADALRQIETAGRTCYKSEGRITPKSASEFVQKLIKNGHEAMLEHYGFSVRFICDRGVTHELVRHRHFSFAQESTRYCNYLNKGMEFIVPCWMDEGTKELLTSLGEIDMNDPEPRFEDKISQADYGWTYAMGYAELIYNNLIYNGWSPQQARTVLPHSLKAEIVVTGNIRQWRHFFKLRTAPDAHPQMQELAGALLAELRDFTIPVVFDDIGD